MSEASNLTNFLSGSDYELIICTLLAEIIAGDMEEKYRVLRYQALLRLRGVLNQYRERQYHPKLLSGIAEKKGQIILKAKSKTEIDRIFKMKAPHFNGVEFIPDDYMVAEEELICWSEASLKGPLVTPAFNRYMDLFRMIFPDESKKLSF